MKLKLLIFFFISSTLKISSQNLIKNGDFEMIRSGESYPQGDDFALLDRLQFWESRTSDDLNPDPILEEFFHSPDWIYNNRGSSPNQGVSLPPKFGNGMIAMYEHELIQQNIGNQIEFGKKYQISFYYYLGQSGVFSDYDFSNTVLKVYLSKNRMKYKNEGLINFQVQSPEDYCTEDYISYKSPLGGEPETIEIINEPDYFTLIQGGTYDNTKNWIKFSKIIEIPYPEGCIQEPIQPNCGYNWFVLALESKEYLGDSDCQDGYLFIDRLSMHKADGCEIECREPLNDIEINMISRNICQGGEIEFESTSEGGFFDAINDFLADFVNGSASYPEVAFGVSIKNAIGYRFTVFSRESEIIYERQEYDVNGLRDPGEDDYWIQWKGDDPILQMISFDSYTFTIEAWNCEDAEVYYDYLIYVGVPDGIPTKPRVGEVDDHNCCPDRLYIQNKLYFSPETVKAATSISAGFDVDPDPTALQGNVTFVNIPSYSPTVEYIAPNIFLDFGFVSGPNFTATIGECELYAFRYSSSDRNIYFNEDKKNIYSEDSAYYNNAAIYPNPIKSGEQLYLAEDVDRIEVLNANYSLIGIYNNIQSPVTIDAAKGIYFVKIISKNKSWCFQKLCVL